MCYAVNYFITTVCHQQHDLSVFAIHKTRPKAGKLHDFARGGRQLQTRALFVTSPTLPGIVVICMYAVLSTYS